MSDQDLACFMISSPSSDPTDECHTSTKPPSICSKISSFQDTTEGDTSIEKFQKAQMIALMKKGPHDSTAE